MIDLGFIGDSFGCSEFGERLIAATRDGDLQETKSLLDYNPKLANYKSFGLRNSPLHFSAAQGHHEIVALLLESGVDLDLRNARGLTALMLACQSGHWEVVQTLMLFKANILKKDYLHGGTALHLASLNGHARCIRLLLADYVPSIPEFWHIVNGSIEASLDGADLYELGKVINGRADGGITALHLASLNGHVECVQLLLDLGASVSKVTLDDGSIIDLIGAGSTALHYAACGGNATCCQVLIARGSNLSTKNVNGATPVMVARSRRQHCLETILSDGDQCRIRVRPSPCLSLPLKSIVKIARECGWRSNNSSQFSACIDPCIVCLERKCTVYAQGCGHEFCTKCALYLCSTNQTLTIVQGPPGCIACPLCRHPIVVFAKVDIESTRMELPRTHISSPTNSTDSKHSYSISGRARESRRLFTHITMLSSSTFRSLKLENLPSLKRNYLLCKGDHEPIHCLARNRRLHHSSSHFERLKRSYSSLFITLNKYVSNCRNN